MNPVLKHNFYQDQFNSDENISIMNKNSIIQSDCVIEGHVRASKDIEILGNIKGDVSASHINLDKNGEVCGDLLAEKVSIAGSFTGKIDASSTQIAPIANVDADIKTSDISVGYGASINIRVVKKKI